LVWRFRHAKYLRLPEADWYFWMFLVDAGVTGYCGTARASSSCSTSGASSGSPITGLSAACSWSKPM
jgi:hypothetical protein